MTILKAFGQRAKEILHMAQSLASCAQTCNVYVSDTMSGPGQGEYDLELAAQHLEDAARDLRELNAKIKASRRQAQPPRIPVLTYGYHA